MFLDNLSKTSSLMLFYKFVFLSFVCFCSILFFICWLFVDSMFFSFKDTNLTINKSMILPCFTFCTIIMYQWGYLCLFKQGLPGAPGLKGDSGDSGPQVCQQIILDTYISPQLSICTTFVLFDCIQPLVCFPVGSEGSSGPNRTARETRKEGIGSFSSQLFYIPLYLGSTVFQ